jgi:isocitrate dehydrogenase
MVQERERFKQQDVMETNDGKIVIPFIEGDGIGKEITSATRIVIDTAIAKVYNGQRSIEWKELLAGEKAYTLTGSWLPAETMNAFRKHKIGIKGPLTTPVGGGMRSLNVTLRQELDLYVCLRPVRYFNGISSPLRSPEKVDMTIFRENTEDIYAGIEWMQGTPEAHKFYRFLSEEMGVTKVRFPETSSFGVKPVSVEGTERIVKAAIDYALEHKHPSVTIVHKGNIMKYTEGGFMNWGYAFAEKEYGDDVFTSSQYNAIKKQSGIEVADKFLTEAKRTGKLIIKDVITDAFLQNSLLKPEDYSVIVTLNLNGDYISDQLAAMVGGIGIAPGANINYQTGHAIFEATHGTAPEIAGKGVANPCSLLLSGVMMLDFIGWSEAAEAITGALEKSIGEGYATPDLTSNMMNGKTLSTGDFASEIIKRL